MKILLLGEYSNLHNSLKQALLNMGHEVLLVGNGDGFKKYGWEWEDGFVAPNFGFVYCRDVKLGAELLKIAQRENLQTVVDEFATLLYVNCSLDEYIKKYLPSVVRGSSNDKFILDKRLHILCKKFNDYVDTQIELKPYFEHV